MSETDNNNNQAGTAIGKDSVVTFHYTLYQANDDGKAGKQLESSAGGNPVAYLHGHKNIVRGLEAAMEGRTIGEEYSLLITPEQGYGLRNDDAVRRVPSKHIYEYKKGKNFRPGQVVTVQTNQGQRQVVVVKPGKFNVDVDFNHPLAGTTLFYEIKIEDVRPATQEELAHGHAHGIGGHHH